MKNMLSSINTLYLVCLKENTSISSEQYNAKQLSSAIFHCACKIAQERKFTYTQASDLILATNFFIENWRNYG